MPEGIEDVARAFQAEIAPGAARPRDDAGRFTSTSAPEKMFEPRPLEGDPLTGDTRDGGEDPRLAERERRIADGWSEEGDEARRSSAEQANRRNRQHLSASEAGEGARHAAADEGHPGAEAEQAGDDDLAQQSDQDGEGVDERTGPEGPSVEDAEAFKVTTADGQPVTKFEVTVDGQSHEVSLSEALRGYIREATFHQRMNKVAEARQAIELEAGAVGQMRDAYVQRLAFADRMLAEFVPPEPDWDREFAVNQTQAREKQKAYGAIYEKRQQIAQEMQRAAQEQQADYDRRARDYAIRGFSQFVQEANIPDEKTLQTKLAKMRAYGKRIGFNEGELATVYDPRMLRVLYDAAEGQETKATLPKPVIPGRGKTLTPGVATPIGNATRRSIDDAQQRLARTGRLDDAAALFQRLIR